MKIIISHDYNKDEKLDAEVDAFIDAAERLGATVEIGPVPKKRPQ